jgi:peptidoglycan/LPS O-acetylase OafA/YrhL
MRCPSSSTSTTGDCISAPPSALSCCTSWSLAVEEQFYLIWPLVLVGLLKVGVRRAWLAIVVLLGIAAAIVNIVTLPPTVRLYVGTDVRAVSLLAGSLVAVLAHANLLPQARWSRIALRAAALVAVGVLAWHLAAVSIPEWYVHRGIASVVALITAVILAALLQSPPRLLSWALEWSVLRWFGRISYGLYLWHAVIIVALTPSFLVSTHPWRWLGVQVGLSVAVATLSFYLLETPFLRLKDRLRAPERTPGREQEVIPLRGQAA